MNTSTSQSFARLTTMVMVLSPCLLGCFHTSNAFINLAPSIRSDHACRFAATVAAADLEQLKIVFSDIDGALIHYPKGEDKDDSHADPSNHILTLPPSATGMKGVISSLTLQSCRELRKAGVKLVLVSGMRTSTLLNRLPYLPKADAYCSEAGGRIFYPTETLPMEVEVDSFHPLKFTGALSEDLQPYGLREDRTWRKGIESAQAAGKDGFAGNEISSDRLCNTEDDEEECLIDYKNTSGFPKQEDVIPVQQRKGALWDFARQLQDDHGFVLDTKSYSTCFRVVRTHQTGRPESEDNFQALLKGDIVTPPQLGISTNLGCIEVYPVSSGKRNCCQYLADSLKHDIAKESVCICDDDNDLEMALACAHAYIPALTSESMIRCIQLNPRQFTQTVQAGVVEETLATEAALRLIRTFHYQRTRRLGLVSDK